MSQNPGKTYLDSGLDFTEVVHNDTYPAINPANANLNGKNVLITGASKGIGKATAISFAQAGASGIALGARSSLEDVVKATKDAAKKSGHPEPKILALNLDVTDRKSVEDAASKVSSAFDGKLDVLINNAGYLSVFTPIAETDPDEYLKDWEVNFKGVYLVSRSFIPLLLKSDLKTVVNISSLGALFVTPGGSSYNGTKLAVLRFSEFLMADHGHQGLLAYSIHPGGVMTDLASVTPEEVLKMLVDTPELSADTLVWLTKERREWLAGRYISVNWDMDELVGRMDEIIKADLLKVRMAVNAF